MWHFCGKLGKKHSISGPRSRIGVKCLSTAALGILEQAALCSPVSFGWGRSHSLSGQTLLWSEPLTAKKSMNFRGIKWISGIPGCQHDPQPSLPVQCLQHPCWGCPVPLTQAAPAGAGSPVHPHPGTAGLPVPHYTAHNFALWALPCSFVHGDAG